MMEYYSNVGEQEEPATQRPKNVNCMLPSKGSQAEKATYGVILILWHSRKQNFADREKIYGHQGLEAKQRIFRAVKCLCVIL